MGIIFTQTIEEAKEWHTTYTGHHWHEFDFCIECVCAGKHRLYKEDKEQIKRLYQRVLEIEADYRRAKKLQKLHE